MAKTENAKKVPGALVAAVVVIIAIAAFVPTVYMPYKNKKPTMDAAHQEALDTIAYLDKSIEDQAVIEADIKALQAEWDKYQKDMFVDPNSILSDLRKAMDSRGIDDKALKPEAPTPDPSGTVTAEGNPLYFETINLTFESDREKLLSFLEFVEKESVGCYYIQELESTPIESTDSDGKVIDQELFETKMKIYLYYFNQDEVVAPPETDSDTDSAA